MTACQRRYLPTLPRNLDGEEGQQQEKRADHNRGVEQGLLDSAPRPGNTHVAAAEDVAHTRILRLDQDEDNNGDGKVTCADFTTRSQTTLALNAGYRKLDNDGDGIPCESLPP